MSTGQWAGGLLGAVIGGVLGWLIPGAWTVVGVVYGATIGYTVGGIIDPQVPDVKSPGIPIQQLQFMSNQIGDPICDALGTVKIVGHLLCFGRERSVPIFQKVGGKGGGGHKYQVVGYNYYASWAVGICLGPADELYTIYKDSETILWAGNSVRPVSGGVNTIVIPGFGTVAFYFGTNDHALNSNLGLIQSPNIPYRNLCFAFFDDCLLGNSNRIPSMAFVFRKSPALDFSGSHRIATYDYNPMHATWYILKNLRGFPEEWLHEGDFAAAAETLLTENRGISLLIDSLQACLGYIENINTHIDGILRYGSDGKFHPKLIRNDYTVSELSLIDQTMLLDEPEINRKSWLDTVNEMKVQYSQIVGRVLPVDILSRLIGWYKFNEGGGAYAENSVGSDTGGGDPLPDLTVYDYHGIFWDERPGFASAGYHTDPVLYTHAHASLVPERTLAGKDDGRFCFGVFYRPKGSQPVSGGVAGLCKNIASGFFKFDVLGGASGLGIHSWIYDNAVKWSAVPFTILQAEGWHFLFMSNDLSGESHPEYVYLCVVKPDGTMSHVGFTPQDWAGSLTSLRWLSAGALFYKTVYDDDATDFPCNGSFADLIIYNYRTLPFQGWRQWYDQLRSRYGMPARSGW